MRECEFYFYILYILKIKFSILGIIIKDYGLERNVIKGMKSI